MASQEQLELLKKGVDGWNQWREANPDTPIDLADGDLRGANLKGADLRGANLEGAKLQFSCPRRSSKRPIWRGPSFRRSICRGRNCPARW